MNGAVGWLRAIAAGVVLGVLVLGIVGRLLTATAAVILGSPSNLSMAGLVEVLVVGAAHGAIGGIVLFAASLAAVLFVAFGVLLARAPAGGSRANPGVRVGAQVLRALAPRHALVMASWPRRRGSGAQAGRPVSRSRA